MSLNAFEQYLEAKQSLEAATTKVNQSGTGWRIRMSDNRLVIESSAGEGRTSTNVQLDLAAAREVTLALMSAFGIKGI